MVLLGTQGAWLSGEAIGPVSCVASVSPLNLTPQEIIFWAYFQLPVEEALSPQLCLCYQSFRTHGFSFGIQGAEKGPGSAVPPSRGSREWLSPQI